MDDSKEGGKKGSCKSEGSAAEEDGSCYDSGSCDDDNDDSDEVEEELILDQSGRVAFSGAINFSTRCFDHVLQLGSDRAASIINDCRAVFTARATGIHGYSEGTTFWVGASTKPSTALERLALSIFEHHTADANFDTSRSGAEWWTQAINPHDEIGFHWDRDYSMEADQGQLLHNLNPLFSSLSPTPPPHPHHQVYYSTHTWRQSPMFTRLRVAPRR